MKRWLGAFLLTVLGVLTLFSVAQSAPFLACDPYPPSAGDSLQPTEFILQQCVDKACTQLIGNEIVSLVAPFPNSTTGEVWLHYDVGQIPIGKFYYRIKAVYALDVWGVYRESGWTFFDSERPDPIEIQQKNISAPSNMRLTNQ